MRWVGCSDLVDWSTVASGVDATPRWCADPAIPRDVEPDVGFVACRGDLDRDLLDRRLRAAGADPLRVPVVLVSAFEAHHPVRIGARLAAERARREACAGAPAEHLKIMMPAVVSRRTLLSLRRPAYRPVPRPEKTDCRAADGCRVCAAVCPHDALRWTDGEIELDRLSCTGCGRCVTACPAEAMVDPEFTSAQLDAFVTTLAATLDSPFGVVFQCARSEAPDPPVDWFGLAVPCVGMLLPHSILAPLLLGASAVAVATCRCGTESDVGARLGATAAAARGLIGAALGGDDRVRDAPGGPLPAPLGSWGEGSGFGARGAAVIGSALAPVTWEHPLAAAGLIAIDSSVCTGCEMCATACPSDALVARARGGRLAIEFDPARCTACEACTQRCPEPGAIALQRVLDSDALGRGRRQLVSHELAGCVKCGGSVAPTAVLERLGEVLGKDDVAFGRISSVCVDCRGTSLVV